MDIWRHPVGVSISQIGLYKNRLEDLRYTPRKGKEGEKKEGREVDARVLGVDAEHVNFLII